MPGLDIDLQDGFINDYVIICIDSVEVFNQASITSNQMLGLARQLHSACQGRQALVSVKVTNRKIEREVEVELNHNMALGISIVNGEIIFRHSATPFTYA